MAGVSTGRLRIPHGSCPESGSCQGLGSGIPKVGDQYQLVNSSLRRFSKDNLNPWFGLATAPDRFLLLASHQVQCKRKEVALSCDFEPATRRGTFLSAGKSTVLKVIHEACSLDPVQLQLGTESVESQIVYSTSHECSAAKVHRSR